MAKIGLVCLALLALEVPKLELHTFSIVARDPITGDFAVGVCTFPQGVRRLCPFAKAGVGAVATQASVNVGFGRKGLKLMEAGLSPKEAVEKCIGEDSGGEARQLAMIDAKNPPFAFTGKQCMKFAGSIVGKDYSIQGNMIVSRETLEAVQKVFEETPGSLAGRIIKALRAGKEKGGDFRGHNSCAVIVASSRSGADELLIDLFENNDSEPVESVWKKFAASHRAWMAIGDRELKRGDEGGDVKDLKKLLGVKTPGVGFDEETENALKAFQKDRKLEETGVVNGKTARNLAERQSSEY